MRQRLSLYVLLASALTFFASLFLRWAQSGLDLFNGGSASDG